MVNVLQTIGISSFHVVVFFVEDGKEWTGAMQLLCLLNLKSSLPLSSWFALTPYYVFSKTAGLVLSAPLNRKFSKKSRPNAVWISVKYSSDSENYIEGECIKFVYLYCWITTLRKWKTIGAVYSTEGNGKPEKNSGLNRIRTHDLCDTSAPVSLRPWVRIPLKPESFFRLLF